MRLHKLVGDNISPHTLDQVEFVPHHYANVYIRESNIGFERLRIGLADKHVEFMLNMVEILLPDFYLLYVLHAPHMHEAARYQSPPLQREDVQSFLAHFHEFLTEDARHDLWLFSKADNATLVWDRHDLLYAYGPLQQFERVLQTWGVAKGDPQVPVPHSHPYYPEYDEQEKEVVGCFDWIVSPLRPEDQE